MQIKPWMSGPVEILQHAVRLLYTDNDTNRRLAFLSVDNAVELIIKTYLSLPRRITGVNISRKQYEDVSESFPKLLQMLENQASDKLTGIDLGEIEWYHRLRNQLYHQGNGLTVEREKVEHYADLAKTLLDNLFDFEFEPKDSHDLNLLIKFIRAWTNIERYAHMAMVIRQGETGTEIWPFPELPEAIAWLYSLEYISDEMKKEYQVFEEVWKKLSIGDQTYQADLNERMISDMYAFGNKIHKICFV